VNSTALVNNSTVNEQSNQRTIIILAKGERYIDELFSINLVTGKTVGKHLIAAGTLLSSNYRVSYDTATLTVLPRTITVKAEDKIMDFGAPLPPFTSVITAGLVNGDTPGSVYSGTVTYSLAPSAVTSPGTYTITPGGLTLINPNYAFQYLNGTLFVNPAGSGAKAVKPILECIEELPAGHSSGFGFVAWFRYQNDNAVSVYVPPGPDNRIESAGPFSGQLPFEFKQGVSPVFPVYFTGQKLTWRLSTNNSTGRKTAAASEASSTSARCKSATARMAAEAKRDGADLTGLSVRPNPVREKLAVSWKGMEAGNVVITLVDATGRERLVRRLTQAQVTETELDVTPLANGIYLLKIQTGDRIRLIRVVKQ
jgi:hypothetical protein